MIVEVVNLVGIIGSNCGEKVVPVRILNFFLQVTVNICLVNVFIAKYLSKTGTCV